MNDLKPLGLVGKDETTYVLAIQKFVSRGWCTLSDHDKYTPEQYLKAIEWVNDKLRIYPGGKYRIVSICTEVHKEWNT